MEEELEDMHGEIMALEILMRDNEHGYFAGKRLFFFFFFSPSMSYETFIQHFDFGHEPKRAQ